MARLTARRGSAVLVLVLAAGGGQRSGAAQSPVTVTPGPAYGAGAFHRLLMGSHYRDLWTTPIAVDVLNLDRVAGGLTPTRCGGGRQTTSVRFRAADGREYAFRSVDKEPSLVLPAELRRTFAAEVLQDQISSAHPAGPLVVAPLLEAAGVLHAEPMLAVLPDDPRLRVLPCGRPGMLGILEERPTERADGEGFAGASDFVGTERLFQRLEDDPEHRIAAREYLTARLLDVFVGDWDRHQDQWRWARLDRPGGVREWHPIPRDRDQAFSRFDGVLPNLAGFYHIELVGFEDEYASMKRLTWTGRGLDSRLLAGLHRSAWDSVALRVRSRLTDSVIDAAVHRLPPEYYAKGGAELARALRARRDRLPAAASEYYELVARTAEIHATDRRDDARVERLEGGRVRVALAAQGRDYYDRTFDPRETEEIRLFLHGGDDRLTVRGGDDGPILRVVGGGGDDALADSARGGRQRFYDDRGTNAFIRGSGTKVDTRRWVAPPVDTVTLMGPPDHGSVINPISWLGYSSDLGLFLGGGFVYRRFGFRYVPWKSRWTARAGWAFGAQRGRAEVTGESRALLGQPAIATLHLRASGIDVLNFYGFGNETSASGPEDFFELRRQQYLVQPGLAFPLGRGEPGRVWLTASFKHARTDPEAGSFFDTTGPYVGGDDYTQLGAEAGFRWDSRDVANFASRGLYVDLAGALYPATLDVAHGFATLRGEIATYLSLGRPATVTLAVRAGGGAVRASGGAVEAEAIPFHELVYVGGRATVRGYPEDRFAGERALWGNAEVRLKLFDIFVVLPGELGVFGLGDVGRVYLDSETSDVWHGAAGGGLWISFLNRRNTLTVAIARSPEQTGVYLRAGFSF